MEKKIPMRTCVACRENKDKREMLRIVKYEGEIFPDKTGKANGRGAYVCKNAECVKKLKKGKILNRVFSCPVDESVYDAIAEEVLGKQE